MTGQQRTLANTGDELALRLCELVGADPAQTTDIALEAEAGAGARVTWTCARNVPLDEIARVISGVNDAPPCMETAPQLIGDVYAPACTRFAGHPGPHRNDTGMEWWERAQHGDDAGPAGGP